MKKFLHDKLHWGFPKEKIGGDNFQPNYSCQFCPREVIQDSGGSWFHLTDK